MLAVADAAQDIELDRGAASVAPGTQRTCALTRELKPVAEMIRFVVAPGDTVVADVKRKLPGRGLWVTGTRQAVEDAVKRNVFARGFKRKLSVAAGLPVQTEEMLKRAALDALAMAGKAGLVVAGFAKVEAALGRDETLALLHASDGSADGKRKLDGALRRIGRKRTETDRKSPSSKNFQVHNWIWHLTAQMWYMQPCLPAPGARHSSPACRALCAFGPENRLM